MTLADRITDLVTQAVLDERPGVGAAMSVHALGQALGVLLAGMPEVSRPKTCEALLTAAGETMAITLHAMRERRVM